ncbi:acyl transferase/acyl hydrolase/lysophospholipase [Gorgonomyces haynaldii]|nr:acyl transferase/acyl hydrolase/lysophospholipase [Gorgonomyces haynaldii]
MSLLKRIALYPVRLIAKLLVILLGLVIGLGRRIKRMVDPPEQEETEKELGHLREAKLLLMMKNAKTWNEWEQAASQLDHLTGRMEWKSINECEFYDYKLIRSRYHSLKKARVDVDVHAMIYSLRSGLLRNLGGIVDYRLYNHMYSGTKQQIEDYLEEIVYIFDVLGETPFKEINLQQKIELFNDIKQTFGNTALLLYGGATFGLYHLGVIKALTEHMLLPRIICGSSVGALIAALVCVHTDEELPAIFLPNGINLMAFSNKTSKGNISRKIARLLKHGYLLDVKVLEECVRSNLGDITFEEAYMRTKRILNITVTSTRKNEVPQVLNYLTAPNVLIRSAATASVSMIGLYNAVDLMAKDKNGRLYIWNPSTIKWNERVAFNDTDSPETRIAELFNVNHFILSEATPYIAPLVQSTATNKDKQVPLSSKIAFALGSEIKYRVNQLSRWGLFPQWLATVFDHKVRGHIVIAPRLSYMDFSTIFSNPTYASLSYWILKGEQSTWPLINMIKQSTIVEFKLHSVANRLKTIQERDTPTDSKFKSESKRNKSIA